MMSNRWMPSTHDEQPHGQGQAPGTDTTTNDGPRCPYCQASGTLSPDGRDEADRAYAVYVCERGHRFHVRLPTARPKNAPGCEI
jgi:hypothetical protein